MITDRHISQDIISLAGSIGPLYVCVGNHSRFLATACTYYVQYASTLRPSVRPSRSSDLGKEDFGRRCGGSGMEGRIELGGKRPRRFPRVSLFFFSSLPTPTYAASSIRCSTLMAHFDKRSSMQRIPIPCRKHDLVQLTLLTVEVCVCCKSTKCAPANLR